MDEDRGSGTWDCFRQNVYNEEIPIQINFPVLNGNDFT